jgi:hypothetical protein
MTTLEVREGQTFHYGLVRLDDSPTFEALYDPTVRWNGWLCPYLDRANTEKLVDLMNEWAKKYPEGGSFAWDGDVVVETVEDGDETHVDRHEPIIVAGTQRWTIGAFSWVWSAA